MKQWTFSLVLGVLFFQTVLAQDTLSVRIEAGGLIQHSSLFCCVTEPNIALPSESYTEYPVGFNIGAFAEKSFFGLKNRFSAGVAYKYWYVDHEAEINPALANQRTVDNFSDYTEVHTNQFDLVLGYDRGLWFWSSVGIEIPAYRREWFYSYGHFEGERTRSRTGQDDLFFQDLGLVADIHFSPFSVRLKYYLTEQYLLNICYNFDI